MPVKMRCHKPDFRLYSNLTFWAASGDLQVTCGWLKCPLRMSTCLVGPSLCKRGVISHTFGPLQICPSVQPWVTSRRPLEASRWPLDDLKWPLMIFICLVGSSLSKRGVTSHNFGQIQIWPSGWPPGGLQRPPGGLKNEVTVKSF